MLPNSFYRASVSLDAKTRQRFNIKKQNYRRIFLMNIDAKRLSKIVVN